MAAVETVTVLFTDLVGSTSLSTSVGPTAAETLRQEHFSILREAIEEAGGREVKNLGDGLMVVFGSVSGALDCAAAMQRRLEKRNRKAGERLAVRIGIAMGEADVAEDDYFGPPVVEASRLCASAQGGQVLVGPVVRMMLGGRESHELHSIGELELKGLPEPVEAFEVAWQVSSEESLAEGVPLPGLLQGVPPFAYVGRSQERETMERLWGEAAGGARRIALMSGEPGIGKTRLASHAALAARSEGAVVLWGRCTEDLGAPYEPWIEALTHYVEHAPEGVLEAHVGASGGELSRLVPALTTRMPDAPEPRQGSPETERYLLFGAVGSLLEAACAEAPMVLVLDDLHWADGQTLSLLKHVTASKPALELLMLGTFRDSDLSHGHPLTDALADLRRIEGVERVHLEGLGADDVIEIMQAMAGHEMDPAGLSLAAEIAAETDGNPFFVAEMLRHLSETGTIEQGPDGRWRLGEGVRDLGLPQSVREVIGRRVERLGADARQALTAGAVIGREFDMDLLARVLETGEDDLLDLLEEAVEASILLESGDRPGRFTFAHALVNNTLYQDLRPTRRARLHRSVAEALEAICGEDPGARVGELAHHWSAATASVDPGKALSYTRRAGEKALADLAPDEAVRWFAHGLELIDGMDSPDLLERCDMLIGLGEGQQHTGDPSFRETLLRAAHLAEQAGDAERLCRAALANTRGLTSEFGHVDEERVAMLERAIELDRLADPARAARLLGLEAKELQFEFDHERRRALADEALALAREVGDELALAYVLLDWSQAWWAPDALERRRPAQKELLELAERLGDPDLRFYALTDVAHTAVQSGHGVEARALMDDVRAMAGELGRPTMRWHAEYFDGCLLYAGGDLEGLERRAEAAAEIGTEFGEPDVVMIYSAQISQVRIEQARAEEILDVLAQGAEDNPRIPAFRAGLAMAQVACGMADEARAIVAADGAGGFANIPRDQVFTTSCALYARTLVDLELAEFAKPLYELIVPWKDQLAWNGASYYGSGELYCGMLAALLGHHDAADAHFAAACEVHGREGVRAFLPDTELRWGESLLRRGDEGAGREHLARARELAREMGWVRVERAADATLAGVSAA